MRRTLKSQVQELSVLPIVGLTAVGICVSLLLTRERVSVEAERILNRETVLLCSVMRERQSSLLSETQLFTDISAVKEALADRNTAELAQRSRRFVADPHIDAVLIANQDAKVVSRAGMDVGAPDGPLVDLLRRGAHGSSFSTNLVQGGRLYCATSVPVWLDKKRVGVAVSLSLLGDGLARQLSDDSSSDVAFVAAGKVVGASFRADSAGDLSYLGFKAVNLAGEDYFGLSRPLPGSNADSGMSLVCLKKSADLAAPFRALSETFVFLLSGALIAALLLARAFAENLSKPLEALVATATAIGDGEWPEPVAVNRQDEVGLLQSVFNDMSAQLRSSHERILALVDTDPLTGLDNHRCFKERLDQEVFRATMSSKPLVLVLMDMDKFQTYNAAHGHAKGDEALKALASLLNEVAPDIAFLSRHGGEEFAMLLPLSTPDEAEALLDRLRTLVDHRFSGELTFTAGIADVGPAVNTGAGLFLCAEFAMSRAKKFGRSQVCRYDVMSKGAATDDPLQLQLFLQDTTYSTIQALAGAVDAKDPYTQGHSVRVAQLSADLARFMGHPKTFVELVYKTATLHDVGKIGVPDSVLSKPARLDAEEQSIMETHPVLGELIVKKAPQLSDMLPGVRHHHERWDGNGYPDQLKGISIPLLARIIAVADTYDAMTSDRPYRRALPHDVAMGELMRKSGTQFDPEIAAAFVRMMQMSGSQLRAA